MPLEALRVLADAPGRLGEMRLIEDDFNHVMACEEKEHPDVAVVRKVPIGTPGATTGGFWQLAI